MLRVDEMSLVRRTGACWIVGGVVPLWSIWAREV